MSPVKKFNGLKQAMVILAGAAVTAVAGAQPADRALAAEKAWIANLETTSVTRAPGTDKLVIPVTEPGTLPEVKVFDCADARLRHRDYRHMSPARRQAVAPLDLSPQGQAAQDRFFTRVAKACGSGSVAPR